MSFSNPVAKSVGADGTAPGRVWESRLLPALITPNIVVGGVLVCLWARVGTPPPSFFVVATRGWRFTERGILSKDFA